jgi:EEF1A lysine methyltransferase 4
LFVEGYTNQCSIDFSSIAIEAMKIKHQEVATLDWQVMDVRRMDFQSASFDVAIDKVFSAVEDGSLNALHGYNPLILAGAQSTLDAMLHGSLWDPEEDVKSNSKAYIDEVRCDISCRDAMLLAFYTARI